MNTALADWHISECDGRGLEQLGVHRILQFPAVGNDFQVCQFNAFEPTGLYVLGLRGLNAIC